MPKSKKGPALYELLTARPARNLPRSCGAATARQAERLSRGHTSPRARPPRPPAEPKAKKPRSARFSASAVRFKRFLRNPARLTAVIGAMAILVFAAYLLDNRWSVLTAPVTVTVSQGDAVERARRQPPRPEVLDLFGVPGAAVNARRPAPAPSSTPQTGTGNANQPTRLAGSAGGAQRRPGLNYVVIESFAPSRREDASAAQSYLAKNGVQATIEPSTNGWVLVTTQGFTWGDAELERQVKRIRQLGQAFFDQGGRYKFLCFAKLYQGKPW